MVVPVFKKGRRVCSRYRAITLPQPPWKVHHFYGQDFLEQPGRGGRRVQRTQVFFWVSSITELQLSLAKLAAECEEAEMKIRASKFENMLHSIPEGSYCPIKWRRYHGILFMGEGRKDWALGDWLRSSDTCEGLKVPPDRIPLIQQR